jgi:hypothetical protein
MLVGVNRSVGAALLCATIVLVAPAVSAQSDGEASAPAASGTAGQEAAGSATAQAPAGTGVPDVPAGGLAEDGGGSPEAPAAESGDEPVVGDGEPYARDPYEVAPETDGGVGEDDGGAREMDEPYGVDPYETDPYDDGE